jgi:hypothetical protein
MDSDKQPPIERERRWAARVAGATVLALVLIVAGQGIEISALDTPDNDAEALTARAEASGQTLAGAVLRSIGLGLLVAPLIFLFDAAATRSSYQMGRFRLLVIMGPILLGISTIFTALAYDSIASTFVEGSPTTGEAGEERAADLRREDTLFQIAGGLGFAALLALVFGTIYTALHAMRVGLVTRFWGTLGMAFGAFIFLGVLMGSPLGLLGTAFFLMHAGLVASGKWFGGTLPAWEKGEAVPWPTPGGEPPAPPREEEAASPEDFEQRIEAAERGRPGRRDNRRKRKRKQR